jgi:cell wall-associated NlpC family hydrolase
VRTLQEKIIDEARKWIGVRFRHQGRSRRGVDCSGFVCCVAGQVLGFDPIEKIGRPRYNKKPDEKELRDGLKRFCKRIKQNEAMPGDIVLMAYENQTTHIGFVTEHGVIHSTAQARGVVEQGFESRLKAIAYYRLPEGL